MYRVRIERRAKKEIDSLPKTDGDRVARALLALQIDPRRAAVKLTGYRNLWRARVGRYRIFFQIRDQELLVLIVRVVKRDEGTYRSS